MLPGQWTSAVSDTLCLLLSFSYFNFQLLQYSTLLASLIPGQRDPQVTHIHTHWYTDPCTPNHYT